MVAGEDVAGETDFSPEVSDSGEVDMMTVALERLRGQTNDSRHDQTGNACVKRRRVSRVAVERAAEKEGRIWGRPEP